MKKIILNVISIILIFFIFDYSIFLINKKQVHFTRPYSYMFTKKIAVSDEYDKDFIEHTFIFRKPNIVISKDSPEKNQKSIVFTGCSFMYGTGLTDEQTLPYKIAQLTNYTTYNLGLQSTAINTTLALLKTGLFFEKVQKEPVLIVYNYADFHIQRLVMPNVILENNEFLYKIVKNNHLERKRPPFIISRFALLSTIRKYIYEINIRYNKHYKKYLQKLLKLHFLEVRKAINNKYPNTKFIILEYYYSPIFEEISPELENEGFIIIRINQDFNIHTNSDQYNLPDGHPNEKVWDEIAPLLTDKMKPYL